jgi:hypothetical protein
MSLHARSVAAAAGAKGPEVELVAAEIAAACDVTLDAARRALGRMRARDDVAGLSLGK